jgi:uncharacterized membrane protein required for colicin V production
MTKGFINFLYATNGKRKTIQSVVVIAVAPWTLFITGFVLNIIGDLLKTLGIGGIQRIVLPVVFVGCIVLSIIAVVGYFYSWWKIYRRSIHH